MRQLKPIQGSRNRLIFSKNGHWNNHVETIIAKASSRLNILWKNKFLLNHRSLKLLYFSYVHPLFEHANIFWDYIPLDLSRKLENINIDAALIVADAT